MAEIPPARKGEFKPPLLGKEGDPYGIIIH